VTKLAERIFSWCLYVYPTRFRERMAESMRETFAESYRASRHRALFFVRTLANVLVFGFIERWRPSIDRPMVHSRRPTPTLSTWLEGLLKEARFALRSLLLRPGFTAVAILTLALGIGANSAIFSVVHAVILRPLDYQEPSGLMTVHTQWAGGVGSMSYPDMEDLERDSAAIETLVGVSSTDMTLTGLGDPVVVTVTRVTEGLMAMFRVAPSKGRDIRAEEFGENGPAVVVVSYDFWQSRLGGVEDVLGTKIDLTGNTYEIVGVAPAGFHYPMEAELWVPRRMNLEDCGRGCHTMIAVGRLAPEATLDRARMEAEQISARLRSLYPDTNTREGFLLRSLQDEMVGDVRAGLLLLLGAVGLVALIACANVANLLLARASSRTGEVAIRTAIGASRSRLVGQSLLESGLLACFGGLTGLTIAWGGLRALPILAPQLPRLSEVRVDGAVLLFTCAAVVVVTFLFGLAPAFALVRSSVSAGLGLASSGRMGENRGSRRFRTLLLVGEVALSAFLLVGAGLVLRSFAALQAVDVGFETQNIVRFGVILPEARYPSIDTVRGFYRELEARLRAIPGIDSVGSVWGPPLGDSRATGIVLVEGRPEPPPELQREASIHSVGPGWLETMRVPLRRGRLLETSDDAGGEPVAVVNETFVRENFPGEDPIGRLARITVDFGYGSPPWKIVGVVGDVHSRHIGESPDAQIYVPHGQYGPEDLTVCLRTVAGIGAASVLPQARAILHEMDPLVPLYGVETVDQAVARQISPTRFYLWLIGTFAVLAALLAAVGLYGVVAYSASRCTRELGLRMALGAEQGGILKLVLVQGMMPALIGLALGLSAAYLGGHVMSAILFGVEPRDPFIFAATAIILVAVALMATLLPAHRASRVDPAAALRLG
jgi:putative ABC transport system permease protein